MRVFSRKGLVVVRGSLPERLWSRVAIKGPDDCWPWIASLNAKGYGTLRGTWRNQRCSHSHRAAYLVSHGEIPEGMHVMHRCDNPRCCNPRHLVLGTNEDNRQDMMRKGRQVRGEKDGAAKLTADAIPQIRKLAADGMPKARIAAQFGVCRASIRKVVARETWGHVS